MPQRFLKPGITTSKKWDGCSWQAQSFYIRLLTLVDDFGRYDGDCMLLRSHAFPLRDDVSKNKVAELCKELQEAGLTLFYSINGKDYLQLTNWSERARAESSRFPDPPTNGHLQTNVVSVTANVVNPQENSAESCLPRSSFLAHRSSPTPLQVRIGGWFGRKEDTAWSSKELKALKIIESSNPDHAAVGLLESYYQASFPKDCDYRRRDILTLLNNWNGEMDRSRKWKESIMDVPIDAKPVHSVFNLKTIMEAKQKRADALKHQHASEDPFGTLDWSNEKSKAEYYALRKEIKAVQSQIASMA